MKKFLIPLLFFFPLCMHAQADHDFIHWSASKKLNWDDFKGNPQTGSDAAALTATHLGFAFSFIKGQVTYNIECRFDKNRSWVLIKNDWILGHEQGHFDIAEIFARKLKKEVSAYTFNKNTFQKDLDVIYNKIMKEKEALQNQYDDETDFSRNKPKQEEWLKKIEKMLEELKAFSDYR